MEDEVEEEGQGSALDNKPPLTAHPLLNDVVLDTLMTCISPCDLPSVRKTCEKWARSSLSKFKREFIVDLSGNCITAVSRKTARFIYSMPCFPSGSSLPFDSFKVSETRLGIGSLDRSFMTHVVPKIRRIHLVPRNKSVQHFWTFLSHLESLEEMTLALAPEITSSSADETESSNIRLNKVIRIKWLNGTFDQDENEEIIFGMDFLIRFYKTVEDSLQRLELSSIESWRHLQVIGSNGRFLQLNSIKLSTLSQRDLDMLHSLCENKLSEFVCLSIASDVKQGSVERFLCHQCGSLRRLQIGWTKQDRMDMLDINLPQLFPQLQILTLKLSTKQRYQPISFGEKFPILMELSVQIKDVGNIEEKIYFWEDLIQTMQVPMKRVHSMRKLELLGVHLRFSESFRELMILFPNVQSLTLGRPSKQVLTTLWSLWPKLKELKIISACPQIDEVLTGIPTATCRRILIDRHLNSGEKEGGLLHPYLDGSVPSIRDLKYLQHFEINGKMSSKLQTLTCLPSDVVVHFGFLQMSELRRVLVHRSLISDEANAQLVSFLPPWGTVKIEQIKFEFDETIDAFQFHRNNQQFMKLLCRYPQQSLQNLPSFLTSLWIQGRLDL